MSWIKYDPKVGQTIYARTNPKDPKSPIRELTVTKIKGPRFYACRDGRNHEREFSTGTWVECTPTGTSAGAMDGVEYAEYLKHEAAVVRLKAAGYQLVGVSPARSIDDLTANQIESIADIIES